MPLWLGRDHVSTKNQPQRFGGGDQSGGEVGNAARGEARGWDAGGGLEEMLRKILSSPYCTGGETHLYNVPKGMWPVKESVS